MPKWYNPQLNEVGSVWLEPSAEMASELLANKETVLGKLRFHCEHGRPEDFDGKFKDQVRTHEKEVLDEIRGVLPEISVIERLIVSAQRRLNAFLKELTERRRSPPPPAADR